MTTGTVYLSFSGLLPWPPHRHYLVRFGHRSRPREGRDECKERGLTFIVARTWGGPGIGAQVRDWAVGYARFGRPSCSPALFPWFLVCYLCVSPRWLRLWVVAWLLPLSSILSVLFLPPPPFLPFFPLSSLLSSLLLFPSPLLLPPSASSPFSLSFSLPLFPSPPLSPLLFRYFLFPPFLVVTMKPHRPPVAPWQRIARRSASCLSRPAPPARGECPPMMPDAPPRSRPSHGHDRDSRPSHCPVVVVRVAAWGCCGPGIVVALCSLWRLCAVGPAPTSHTLQSRRRTIFIL